MNLRLAKYQALGNDYLVVSSGDLNRPLVGAVVARLCDRHLGIGADGILVVDPGLEEPSVQIWNADGSLAERSGNGLRIAARWLWDSGHIKDSEITLATAAGGITARATSGAIALDMGQVTFGVDHGLAPVAELLSLPIGDLRFYRAHVGNPHCVVLELPSTPETAQQFGPQLEQHPTFPHRTNVQFVHVTDREHLQIEIWERGSGYTLASGSCSCAAAAVAHGLNLLDASATVNMPGGALLVDMTDKSHTTLIGPAERIAEITVADEQENRLMSLWK